MLLGHRQCIFGALGTDGVKGPSIQGAMAWPSMRNRANEFRGSQGHTGLLRRKVTRQFSQNHLGNCIPGAVDRSCLLAKTTMSYRRAAGSTSRNRLSRAVNRDTCRVSHSQTVRTFQPSCRRCLRFLWSRATLRCRLAFQ